MNIRGGKEAYSRKLKQRLLQKDTREVWRGTRIIGYKLSSQTVDGNIDRTDELNVFFNKFNMQPHILHFDQQLPRYNNSSNPLTISVDQVRSILSRCHPAKAAGPNCINQRVLDACAPQLCVILQYLFNLSLCLEMVPVLWKKITYFCTSPTVLNC